MGSEIVLIVSAVAVLLVGLFIGYKMRPQTGKGELNALRERLQESKAAAQALQTKFDNAQEAHQRRLGEVQETLHGRVEESKEKAASASSRAASLQIEVQGLEEAVASLRLQLEARSTDLASANASLQALRDQNAEREENFKTQRELSEAKQAELSKKLLKEITDETLALQNKERLAREEADEMLRKERQKAFESEFKKLAEHLKGIEKSRAEEGQSFKDQFAEILKQSGEIQKEAVRLTTALGNVKVQGDFGEIRLERLLEYSGLREGIHFHSQAHVSTDDGSMRPDIVVCLADDNKVVIDSKAPLNAFFASLEAPDAKDREQHLKQYARAIKGHVQTLGSKSYQDQFKGAAPFTVMFLPGESAFLAALEADSSLLDYAIQKGILIATSSTLVGLLKVVHVGHRQLEAVEESERILKIARDVYERGHLLVEHTVKIGAGLKGATDAYNNVIKSYESRFLPKGRELASFATSAKALPEVTDFKEMPDVREPSPDKLVEGGQLMARQD